MDANRPLTQRELKKQKKTRSQEEYVLILNRTNNQNVPIQLKAPKGVDWFVGEQTVNLHPRKSARFPRSRLYSEQIRNQEMAGRIKVLKSS